MISNAGGGHLSMPLGFADVMSVLVNKFLNFNPSDSKWFNRDRLVLSAGHGSALLYSYYFLSGYDDIEFQDLVDFRKFGAKTSSHPEYGNFLANEMTTGALGQGVASAVGMAIAAKKYNALLSDELANYKIYVIAGDGCLMEGVAYEALSLAGHLKLDNLVLLFDNNNVTADGAANSTISEDQILKMRALGWDSLEIDGHDYGEIEAALDNSKNSVKPYFIQCNTKAGFGTNIHDHMGGVTSDELNSFESDALEGRFLEEYRLEFFKISPEYHKWQKALSDASASQLELITQDRPSVLLDDFKDIDHYNISTRKAFGICLEKILKKQILKDKVILGSADLGKSTYIKNLYTKEINANNFLGNYLNYGVREHAMAAIMNGIALSGMLAIGSSYLSFSDYMRPAIRMAAMQKLPVLYIFTHDSIDIGEDGPTHQPIEHLDSFKIMPDINVARPSNFSETVDSLEFALNSNLPTIFAFSRGDIKYNQEYLYKEADLGIFASGSDVMLACHVAEKLGTKGISAKVISVPIWYEGIERELYSYDFSYKIAIEKGSGISWHQVIGDDGLLFSVNKFGVAGDARKISGYFGMNVTQIIHSIEKYFCFSKEKALEKV